MTLSLLCLVQPSYRVVPVENRLRRDGESANVSRYDRARRFRESIQRPAARIEGVPARAADEYAIDAGRKLRRTAAEKPKADQAAQEAARECLRYRLRSFDHPHFFRRGIGDGERASRE